jgi:hypothetical protein
MYFSSKIRRIWFFSFPFTQVIHVLGKYTYFKIYKQEYASLHPQIIFISVESHKLVLENFHVTKFGDSVREKTMIILTGSLLLVIMSDF